MGREDFVRPTTQTEIDDLSTILKARQLNQERIKQRATIIIETALGKQPLLKAFLQASNKLDMITITVPKIISILLSSDEGVEILKELGLYDEFKDL